MASPPLPETLVKANTALFDGRYEDVLRLTADFREKHPADARTYRSMIMWLDAQAQVEPDERVRRLYALLADAHSDDAYTHMARTYLREEETYDAALNPPRRRFRWAWAAAGVAVAAALVVMVLQIVRATSPAETISEAQPTPTATPVTLPDRSQPLVAEGFTARYEAGVLRLTAFENQSSRVIDAQTGDPIAPIPGARFYALQLNFECRQVVCNAPPEGELALIVGDGQSVTAREDVRIQGAAPLEAIALGRNTSGWVVFEIPTLYAVEALQLIPAEQDADPIVIDLQGIFS